MTKFEIGLLILIVVNVGSWIVLSVIYQDLGLAGKTFALSGAFVGGMISIAYWRVARTIDRLDRIDRSIGVQEEMQE